MPSPDIVATAAQLACLLEVSASKPGNVSPTQRFRECAIRALPRERSRDRACDDARR